MKPSRSELAFASLVSYCPRGETALISRSNRLMRQVKENRVIGPVGREEAAASMVARRLREIAPLFLDEYFGSDVTLVPVPRSTLRKPGALWPSHEIAASIHAEGLGVRVLPCLERAEAIPKAATSRSNERPKARAHMDSLRLSEPLSLPAKVTLVDDVVTRGAQLFGAAWRIWSVRPDVVVRAFAVIRTISDPGEFVAIGDPCTGRIEWRAEECYRIP